MDNFYRKSYQKLSKDLNRSTSTLHKWADFLKLKRLSLEEHVDIKVMFDNGYTTQEIAKAMGMTDKALKLWARTTEGCSAWELEQRARKKNEETYG